MKMKISRFTALSLVSIISLDTKSLSEPGAYKPFGNMHFLTFMHEKSFLKVKFCTKPSS